MDFDKIIESSSPFPKSHQLTFCDILFSVLNHRKEECSVLNSHIGEQLVKITLKELRTITLTLSARLEQKGIKKGDTIMLASFSCSNELANVLIFAAAASIGVRIFIPIFPEAAEFSNWKNLTGFSYVIIPYREILGLQDHAREREIIEGIRVKCEESMTGLLDSDFDFQTYDLISDVLKGRHPKSDPCKISISPGEDMVIFTTSGSSGKSKLVVYSHESFAVCCQLWQESGLFSGELFGNTGFSPLFTHTIGIRTFINCLWSGNPFCVIVTDWFLHKPAVVRYFLLDMQPGHIIGGPAFFNTMLELFRQYPELKLELQHSLKAAISIGAPFDITTSVKFRSATGVEMMNGFGTTETLMISLNTDTKNPRNLGMLLPGVTLGLKRFDQNLFELAIRSPFQSVRSIGESKHTEFFETGDLVEYDEASGQIIFHGRKSADFLKDEYGVKIPLNSLKDYYKEIYQRSVWIEWIPLVNIPGLAALIFTIQSENSQKELAAIIKYINEELRLKIEPFEYAHRHLERFVVINDELPLTRKGTVSKDQIFKRYDQVIAGLRNPFVFSKSIEVTETGDKSDLFKFSNPYLAELLEALKIDREYTRAEGDYLYCRNGESTERITDFVGGFGANLLGHNHPKVREAVMNFLGSGNPALNDQGSIYHYPSLLARSLNHIFSEGTGKYFKVLFANSGAEAAELAIHHAWFEWRSKIEKMRDEQYQLYGSVPGLSLAETWDNNMGIADRSVPCVLVANNCFHGYTSGPRSLLNKCSQRDLFSGLLRLRPLHITDHGEDWKEQVLKHMYENYIEIRVFRAVNGKVQSTPIRLSSIIASIIEPMRGEGGIRQVDHSFADFLSVQEFPLISDEIQCGLGRTGSIAAYSKASYYLLGKSLGGGIEKISAVLIDDTRFRPLFTKYFNSTFANGGFAAATALSVLRVIVGENVAGTALTKGEKLIGMLRTIAGKYPEIIESIEGRGLMIGIHFNESMRNLNVLFRILREQELLGYFFAGWLLNNHKIRVLPSLSKPNSLRIEPSYLLTESEMERLCSALDELCNLCSEKKMYKLLLYLMNGDPYNDRTKHAFTGTFPQQLEAPASGSLKAGFIGNFTISHREMQVLEPDLRQASDTGLRILFERLQVLLQGKPIKLIAKNFMNGRIHFIFYILPFDTSHLEVISRWGKKRYYIGKIQEAVNALADEGAECVSLGAHTSIITGNGLCLAEKGKCSILTGNNLTVGSCIHYLNRYVDDIKIRSPYTIAVVGAAGNIGTGIVECLNDERYSGNNLILLGNNEKRLQRLMDELKSLKINVTSSTDLFELKKADVIICCVNTNDPVIFRHHLTNNQAVYIIDISVPRAVSEDVKEMSNVQFCNAASSVRMTDAPDLSISSHTTPGKIFCCAGETILYALHKLNLPMRGHIHRDVVLSLLPLAEDSGFFSDEVHDNAL